LRTYRDENVLALRGSWLKVVAFFVGVVVAPAVVGWRFAWIGPTVAGVLVVLMLLRHLASEKRNSNALDLASPDAVARVWYGAYVNSEMPLMVPIATLGLAQLHAVYGDTPRAEELLERVDWDKQSPLMRGNRDYVRAFIEHIRGNDVAAARLARAAAPLIELPRWFPGARQARRYAAVMDDLGKMLAEDDRAAASRLDASKVVRKGRLLRGFVAWARSRAEERWGDHEAATVWLGRSRADLPHAYGLGVPRPETVAPMRAPAVLDPANPYAAPAANVTGASDAPFELRPREKGPKTATWAGIVLWVVLVAVVYAIYTFVRFR